MRYYVVIDTNVLVSAILKWNSVPGSVLSSVFEGLICPVLNDEIIKEYQDVLRRPKFGLSKDTIDDILGEIKDRAEFVDAQTIDISMSDPKDKVFYEVVMEKRKEDESYLVTGNTKHFPKERFIVTPREMMDIISSDLGE